MITPNEFIQRRDHLLDAIPSKYATVLVSAREVQKRIPTIPYKFRQHSDMLYLSGYEKPSGVLAMTKSGYQYSSILFLPPPDKEAEMWEGFRTPFDEAKKISGVHKVLPIFEFKEWLRKNLIQHRTVYESAPYQQQRIIKDSIQLSPIIDQFRVIKSPAERALIKKACQITQDATFQVLKDVKPGMYEGEVAENFRLEAIKHGATGFAYEINSASGENALCVHYTDNNKIIKNGTTLLFDAGAEYQHYASDFTQTIHVGDIPKPHLDILLMVNDIKDTLVRECKIGSFINFHHVQSRCRTMLANCLKKFGMKTGFSEMRELFPHECCHWLGLDVHDTPSISNEYELKPGTVFTVEPALYFNPSNPNVPKELAGLGIRFEDTIIYE